MIHIVRTVALLIIVIRLFIFLSFNFAIDVIELIWVVLAHGRDKLHVLALDAKVLPYSAYLACAPAATLHHDGVLPAAP